MASYVPGLDVASLTAGSDVSGTDTSGWLSGLGDLFQGVGSAVSSGLRAANTPSGPGPGSGWVFNPATGGYYNPLTGQALTSTGTLTSAGLLPGTLSGSSGLMFLLIGLVAFLLLRKRE